MLVLSRNETEAIILRLPNGEAIKVQVIQAVNRKARIGIKAPRDVSINREELVERTDRGEAREER